MTRNQIIGWAISICIAYWLGRATDPTDFEELQESEESEDEEV